MSEYCHNHKLYEDASVMSLGTAGNIFGMGATSFPGGPSTAQGGAGAAGSGDKAPTLLPLAMQVAAQTIGLDLVPVVPMAGPMGLLSYLDFVYEGGKLAGSETPTYIKTDEAAAGNDVKVGESRIDGFNIIRIVDALDANGGETKITDRYSNAVLVKALEDHIPGFSGSNDAGDPYSRGAGAVSYTHLTLPTM